MRSAASIDNAALLALLKEIAQQRSPAALARLYDSTSPVLYGLLLRILRRPDWAREALQDCYIRVWQCSDSYVPEKGEPIAWLIGIARYRALDLLRTVKDGEARLEANAWDLRENVPPALDPQDKAVALEGLQRLSRCLRGLQEEQRKSVLLAYYEGYSHQELALAMNAPLGTVKAWVRRGLARLRECLELP